MKKFLLTDFRSTISEFIFCGWGGGSKVFLEGGGAIKKRLSDLEPSPLNEKLYSIMDTVKTSNTESQWTEENLRF